MNVTQMITELRSEREALTQAIDVLERIAGARRRGPGRPPTWLATAAGVKRVFSAATRKKMALAQRKRWAAARKKQAS